MASRVFAPDNRHVTEAGVTRRWSDVRKGDWVTVTRGSKRLWSDRCKVTAIVKTKGGKVHVTMATASGGHDTMTARPGATVQVYR